MNETEKALREFGKLIAKKRKEKKLSQEKFAELCGLSLRQMVKIENGAVNIKMINLIRLCIELDINCGELEQFYVNPYEDLTLGILDVQFVRK